MIQFYENKDKTIMCPECNKFLIKADKRDTKRHILMCRSCRKLIVFVPKTGYTEIHNVPQRKDSSGMRFY